MTNASTTLASLGHEQTMHKNKIQLINDWIDTAGEIGVKTTPEQMQELQATKEQHEREIQRISAEMQKFKRPRRPYVASPGPYVVVVQNPASAYPEVAIRASGGDTVAFVCRFGPLSENPNGQDHNAYLLAASWSLMDAAAQLLHPLRAHMNGLPDFLMARIEKLQEAVVMARPWGEDETGKAYTHALVPDKKD